MRKAVLATLLASVLWLSACTVPAWFTTAENIAETAVPIAGEIVSIADPAVAPVVTIVETGFSALVKTLQTYQASPTATNLQAVQSAFNAVNANVAQLENAAQIKNAGTANTVTQVVALLSQAVAEIAAQIPAVVATQMEVRATVNATPKQWKAKDFKKAFNAIAKKDHRLKKL